MTYNDIKNIISGFGVLLSLALGMSSCVEDRFETPDFTVAGADVKIQVPVMLPEMDRQSRAALDQVSLNRVESLWIRTYSSESGEATSEWVKLTPGSTDTETPRSVTLDTKSGYSYIVGVANVNNMGVTKLDPTTQRPLSELLEEAGTWQEFLDIAVVAPSTLANVNAPTPPLPMAGCYSDIEVKGEHPTPTNISEWQRNNFIPYFIPSTKDAYRFPTGAIHLRRLVSHLNFNIKPANNGIKVSVNSYQVMNAPKYSWLYEREGDGIKLSNFADLATDETDAANFISDIPQFGSQYVTENADGSSSFDYWQSESKHEGASTTYAARDARAAADSNLFTSLTGDTWTPNNEASYVLINCTIDFTNQLNVDDHGNVVNTGGSTVKRTAEAMYLVHLGYMGDASEAVKSKDFNCYRNVDYTYNITVNGVNDIIVNAWAVDNSRFPGETGIVSDLVNATIELDAHYHSFNIQLTEAELSDTQFGILIATYKDGQQYVYDNIGTHDLEAAGVPEEYYNWIELRPTTSQSVMAEYKPRYGNNSDGKTFLLSDLGKEKGTDKWGWSSMTDNMQSTSGWYTVFVNEYSYEPMYEDKNNGYGNESGLGADGRPRWMSYVNQNPRRFYITTNRATSPDGQSIYARSKYGVSQRSMQSFYSDQTYPADGTALGVERFNESEGMNVRSVYGGGSSNINGRYNCAQYLTGQTRPDSTTIASILAPQTGQSSRLWSTYIDQTTPLQIPAVTGVAAQNGPELPARTIAAGNPVRMPKYVNYTGPRSSAFYDPQESTDGAYYVEVMNACTNRNRDNNGNGRIDPEELRWYLPTMSTIVRMVTGAPALGQTPVMDFADCPQLPKILNGNWSTANNASVNNDYIARYFFAGSDRYLDKNVKVLWGMEGLSTSAFKQFSSGAPFGVWQVRCVRNLGINLRNITSEGTVQQAYTHDEGTRTVRMQYFDNSSIRANKYRGNGNNAGQMPIHIMSSEYNKPYKAFEYRGNTISTGSAKGNLSTIQTFINTNPCRTTGATDDSDGWRIPNLTELTIMRDLGLTGTGETVSCTFNYYNYNTGIGGQTDFSTNPTQHKSLISLGTEGTQRESWLQNANIRCVRDVD